MILLMVCTGGVEVMFFRFSERVMPLFLKKSFGKLVAKNFA